MTGWNGRALSFLITIVLMWGMILSPGVHALTYDPILSHPSRIPRFYDYHTPVIVPGDEGELSFTVANRYPETMKNITLYIEIYARATIEEYHSISEVEHPPQFYRTSYQDSSVNGTGAVIYLGSMAPGSNTTITLYIKTDEDTPEGTYFVRMMMVFDYGNLSGVVLKSRGYFSQSQWDTATARGGEFGLDLDILNCTGIIPDTSFSVKKPVPRWPLYVLIGLIVITGGLALFFYMTDELGYFPEAKNRIDGLWNKFMRRKGDKKI